MNYSVSNNVPWKQAFSIPGTASLVGASLHMQLRSVSTSDEVELDLTSSNGFITIVDPMARSGLIHVDGVSMGQVAAGAYLYDCVCSPSGDDAFVVMSGLVTVTQGITR